MVTVVKERHEKAAMIGYWRSGATVKEISLIGGWSLTYVYETLAEYLKDFGVESNESESVENI